MHSLIFRTSILFCLFVSLNACTRIKDKPLEDLVFIKQEAFPPIEQAVSEQSAHYRKYFQDQSLMDSLEYMNQIGEMEVLQTNAIEAIQIGMKKVRSLSVTDGRNMIKDATLMYMKELLLFEKDLTNVLTKGKTKFNRSEFMTELYGLYDKHQLKSKGELFVDKQFEFMRKFNITEHDVEKMIQKN